MLTDPGLRERFGCHIQRCSDRVLGRKDWSVTFRQACRQGRRLREGCLVGTRQQAHDPRSKLCSFPMSLRSSHAPCLFILGLRLSSSWMMTLRATGLIRVVSPHLTTKTRARGKFTMQGRGSKKVVGQSHGSPMTSPAAEGLLLAKHPTAREGTGTEPLHMRMVACFFTR
jgi:hypothetical protein